MAEEPAAVVRVGPQGRIVVPAPLRRRLGIQAGDVLLARAEDQQLVLERREAVLARVRALFAHVPSDVDLADELISERRAEAARETADDR